MRDAATAWMMCFYRHRAQQEEGLSDSSKATGVSAHYHHLIAELTEAAAICPSLALPEYNVPAGQSAEVVHDGGCASSRVTSRDRLSADRTCMHYKTIS